MMIYTLILPLEVSKRPLKYLPRGVTLNKGDNLRVVLQFFDEAGNGIKAEGEITLTGYKGSNLLFQSKDFAEGEELSYSDDLNLNTFELVNSSLKTAKIEIKFNSGDKQRTISFNISLREKLASGAPPSALPAIYPNPEDIMGRQEIMQLVAENKVIIQEKRVTQKNFYDGYISLLHDPAGVTSVIVAGGTAQYGSYDPEEEAFEPDYYLDRSFSPSRLVWRRSWSDGKEFSLNEVIRKGDKFIISYNLS